MDESSSCRCSTTSHEDPKTTRKNTSQILNVYARRFGKGHWSFIGPDSKRKYYSISEDSPQRIWDKIAERMLLEFVESECPIFRATIPLIRGQLKSKRRGKLSIQYAVDVETYKTVFRISHMDVRRV